MRLVLSLALATCIYAQTPSVRSNDGRGKYLGNLNTNRYDPNSVSNPHGKYGSPYSPDSVNNPHGKYGNKYSPYSARNPYATKAPVITGADGEYLGKLSANEYDPDAISNGYGKHGSRYSNKSINNPYSRYGSKYSMESARNPYATGAEQKPNATPSFGSRKPFALPKLRLFGARSEQE